MIGFNHTLMGAIVGVTLKNPLLVAPVAFASHFACDAMPHMGKIKAFMPWKRSFIQLLLFDAVVCFSILAACIAFFDGLWLSAALGMAFATLPDFFWVYYHNNGKPQWPLFKFHVWVQWAERPYGWVYEAIYAGLFAFLLIELHGIAG